MEYEINKKVKIMQEKEKKSIIKQLLYSMQVKVTPLTLKSIIYSELKVRISKRDIIKSIEKSNQIERENLTESETYVNEKEIPNVPNDSSLVLETLCGLALIPLQKKNSPFLKVIDISEPKLPELTQLPNAENAGLLTSEPYPPPPYAFNSYLDPPQMSYYQNPSQMYQYPPTPQYPVPQNYPVYNQNMIMNPGGNYNFIDRNPALMGSLQKKPQNYKTVPCRKFHSSFGCDRGNKCHFIHDFSFQGRPIPNFKDNYHKNRSPKDDNHYNTISPGYYPPNSHNSYHKG